MLGKEKFSVLNGPRGKSGGAGEQSLEEGVIYKCMYGPMEQWLGIWLSQWRDEGAYGQASGKRGRCMEGPIEKWLDEWMSQHRDGCMHAQTTEGQHGGMDTWIRGPSLAPLIPTLLSPRHRCTPWPAPHRYHPHLAEPPLGTPGCCS